MEGMHFKNRYPSSQIRTCGYYPPKSTGFGHRARKKDKKVAWQLIQDFLDKHTFYQLHGASQIIFEISSEIGNDNPYIQNVFENQSSKKLRCKYLKDEQLPEAIDFSISRNFDGELRLHFAYWFLWKKFATENFEEPMEYKDELEWRPITSVLGVTIYEDHIFVQPRFIFPCSKDSAAFKEIYNEIVEDCPVRLRDNYF